MIHGNLDFLSCHSGIDSQSFNPVLIQIFHLVFHQGDERGDNQANAVFCEGRDLEGDGFTAPGREQGKGVFPIQHRLNDLFLDGPEGSISPIFQEYLLDCQGMMIKGSPAGLNR